MTDSTPATAAIRCINCGKEGTHRVCDECFKANVAVVPYDPTTTAALPEPVKRYRRVVDRLECPVCGERLGERWWDYRVNAWSALAYIDSGPTYYRDTVIGSKVRIFKPCGCQVEATNAA